MATYRIETNDLGKYRVTREDGPDLWNVVSEERDTLAEAEQDRDGLIGETTWRAVEGSTKQAPVRDVPAEPTTKTAKARRS